MCRPAVCRSVSRRSLQLVGSLLGRSRFRRLLCCGQIVTLDGGDQLPGFHVVSFIHGQRLNPAGNARADHHFIGINGADQLQIARALGGKEIPAERNDKQNPEQDEDPIAWRS